MVCVCVCAHARACLRAKRDSVLMFGISLLWSRDKLMVFRYIYTCLGQEGEISYLQICEKGLNLDPSQQAYIHK